MKWGGVWLDEAQNGVFEPRLIFGSQTQLPYQEELFPFKNITHEVYEACDCSGTCCMTPGSYKLGFRDESGTDRWVTPEVGDVTFSTTWEDFTAYRHQAMVTGDCDEPMRFDWSVQRHNLH